jgi:hypothetical protein
LANAAKSQRAKLPARRDKHYKNLFQGLLICGGCGGSYIRKNKHSKAQPHYSLYMCARRTNGLTKCSSINGQQLDVNLLTNIYVYAYPHVRTEAEAAELRNRQILLQSEHTTAREKLRRITDAIEATDSPTLYERLTETEKRISEIATELQQVKISLDELKLAERNVGTMISTTFTEDYRKVLDDSEVEFRAQLREKILSVVNRIVVFPDEGAAILDYKHAPEAQVQPLDADKYDVDAVPALLSAAYQIQRE